MTRYEFYDARLAHWKAEADPRIADPEFQALRDVEAAQAAGVTWDPEQPASKPLPQCMELRDNENGSSMIYGDGVPVTRLMGSPERWPEIVAAFAAYNREQARGTGAELRDHGLEQRIEVVRDLLRLAFPVETRAIDAGEDPIGVHWTALEVYRLLSDRDCALCGKPWPHEHTAEQTGSGRPRAEREEKAVHSRRSRGLNTYPGTKMRQPTWKPVGAGRRSRDCAQRSSVSAQLTQKMLHDFMAFQAEPASQAFLGLFLAGGIVLVAAFTVGALIYSRRRK